jgi:hypothetical protein
VSDGEVLDKPRNWSIPACEAAHSVKWHTLVMVTSLALSAGCSGPPVRNGPLFGTGVFHPPPKPGDSISHTLMCECKACEPSSCCDGPEDDAPPESCGDSYDFSSNPG